MNTTFVVNTELTTINCGVCGGIYAIQERFRDKCHEDGTGWHCPYCQKSWGYFKDNKNAKLKRELEAERQRVAQLQTTVTYHQKESDHFRKSRDGWKGVAVKTKKRVAAGVCPCCNRHFPNDKLPMHIASKHPDFNQPAEPAQPS